MSVCTARSVTRRNVGSPSGSASFALLEGDLATAEHHAYAELLIAVENSEPDALVFYGGQLAELRILAGREGEIIDVIAQAATDNPAIPAFRTGLAYLFAATGRYDEAVALLDEMLGELVSIPINPGWSIAVALLAQAASLTRHVDASRIVVQLLSPFTDQLVWTGSSDHGPAAPLGWHGPDGAR